MPDKDIFRSPTLPFLILQMQEAFNEQLSNILIKTHPLTKQQGCAVAYHHILKISEWLNEHAHTSRLCSGSRK